MAKFWKFEMMLFLTSYSFLPVIYCSIIVTSVGEIIKSTDVLINSISELRRKDFDTRNNILMHKLSEIHNQTLILEYALSQIYKQKPDGLTAIRGRIGELHEYLISIRDLFGEFLKIIKLPEGFDEKRKKNFAYKMIKLDESNENRNNFKIIPFIIIPLTLERAEKDLKLSKSPNLFLYEYLTSIISVQMEWYIMKKYSYSFYNRIDEVDPTYLSALKHKFELSIDDVIIKFKHLMYAASTEVWKSNPKELVEGTFEKLNFVFQRFLTTEESMNPNDKCRRTCSFYNYRSVLDVKCTGTETFCSFSSCRGTLRDCEEIPRNWITACPVKNYTEGASERFDWITVGNNRYGSFNGLCPVKKLEVPPKRIHIRRYPFHLSRFESCELCKCVCDEESDRSERFFSLEPVKSNTKDNYVITGARFVKFNRTIFIQIQEGQLLPFGEIDPSTTRWVEINKNPRDTYPISWKNAREIGLTDLISPEGYVLTELLFYVDKRNDGQMRFQLGAFSNNLNFFSGKLGKSSIYLSHNQLENYSEIPEIKNEKFARFEISNFQKDLGKSTIPFFDTRSVTTDRPVPMSGIGIYLNQVNNDDRLLALKLFTHRYDLYLTSNIYDSRVSLQ